MWPVLPFRAIDGKARKARSGRQPIHVCARLGEKGRTWIALRSIRTPCISIGLNSFPAVPPRGGNRAPRLTVSFPHVRPLRELGVARMVRVSRSFLLFPRPGDGVLRDPTFRGAA